MDIQKSMHLAVVGRMRFEDEMVVLALVVVHALLEADMSRPRKS